jgi:hypothetical protein
MAHGKTKADLEQEIADLEEANQELSDQLAAIADIVAPDEDETGDEDDLEDDDEEEDDSEDQD